MTTIFNDQTGAWEDPATWHKGIVPSSSDDVVLDWITPNSRTITTVNGADAAASVHVGPKNQLNLDVTRDNPGQLTVTGEVLVELHGVITGAGTLIAGSINNDGAIISSGVAGARFKLLHIETHTILNSGTLRADSGYSLQVDGDLDNSGEVRGDSGGSLSFGNVKNSGTMIVLGHHSEISVNGTLDNSGLIHADNFAVFSVSANVSNTDGAIDSTSHSVLNFAEGVTNTKGGTLFVNSGGTIEIGGSAIGGVATIAGVGSTLAFNGSGSTTNVTFRSAANDIFVLEHSQSYTGSVAGFLWNDQIDARDIGFNSTYDSYNPATHLLTLGDGTHTTEIKIVGIYTANNFTFHGDTHGGTGVGYIA